MNIDELFEKMNTIDTKLKHENRELIQITKNIANLTDDPNIKNEYYSLLPEHEKIYQKKNDEYKKLISQFSKAYLEICDFYVGDNLPRETYLDSKKDIFELFSLFILAAISEPYVNAYYDKYCV